MLFDNDIRTATNENITDFTPTFGTYTGAAFQEGVRFSPTSSFNRMMEMNFAQKEREDGDFFPLFGKKFDSTGQLVEIPKTNPKLTKQEADSQLKEHGVKLDIDDSGITQDALSLMIDRKKEELAFTFQINAAPDGVIPTVSKFGASLAASLMDPTNIAAAFIPGIGQARYLQMMARTTGAAQRAGIRAGFGLAEGVIGTAALEPIIYAAAQQEQADYTMMDSVYNVLIGGVMGAGLHAGIGGISDAIAAGRTARGAQPTGSTAEALAKVPQQSKEAMFKSALAAEGNGYRANVDPVAAFDSQLNPNSRKAMQESASQVPESEMTPPQQQATQTTQPQPIEPVKPVSPQLEGTKISKPSYQNALTGYSEIAEKLTRKTQLTPETDTLGEAVAKLGGINRELAQAEGLDPAAFKRNKIFPSKEGMSFDHAAEVLNEQGYRNKENGRLTANDVLEIITDEVNQGEKHYSISVMPEMLTEEAAMIRQFSDELTGGEKLVTAIQKALRGEKLGKKQARIVRELLDVIEKQRLEQVPYAIERLREKRRVRAERFVQPPEAPNLERVVADAYEADAFAAEEIFSRLERGDISETNAMSELLAISNGRTPFNLDANVQQDVNAGLESGFNETYSTNNSRTADWPSSQAADETVKIGDVELDQSLQSLTDDINDIAARNEVDISGMLDELDVPIRNAETDAKALEAAVLCRINL